MLAAQKHGGHKGPFDLLFAMVGVTRVAAAPATNFVFTGAHGNRVAALRADRRKGSRKGVRLGAFRGGSRHLGTR